MRIEDDIKLDYSDVLIRPKRSTLTSRYDVDMTRTYKDINELKGKLIVELGSSKLEWNKIYPKLKLIKLNQLTMELLIETFRKNRGDFYIADIEVIDNYKRIKKMRSLKPVGLKVHYETVNKDFIPMNMGFSQKSKLIRFLPNEKYTLHNKNRQTV